MSARHLLIVVGAVGRPVGAGTLQRDVDVVVLSGNTLSLKKRTAYKIGIKKISP